MKKQSTILMLMLFWGIAVFSQEIIVEWNFPNDSADSIADGGIDMNLDKGIYTMGGTSNLSYKNGFETKAAQVSKWDNGSELKCWVVEFTSENFGSLMLSSKLSSGGNNPGPRDFRVDYKVGEDGVWAEVPNSIHKTANDWETGVLENLPLPDECTNRPLVLLRWIMTSDTSSTGEIVLPSGKLKIDDIVIIGTDVSAVGDAGNNHFNVYPNPFTNIITFQNSGEANYCQIIDMTGRTVVAIKIEDGQQLDLSQLKKGIYNLQLFNKKHQVIISRKIIRQ
jgi:hypothetical protein